MLLLYIKFCATDVSAVFVEVNLLYSLLTTINYSDAPTHQSAYRFIGFFCYISVGIIIADTVYVEIFEWLNFRKYGKLKISKKIFSNIFSSKCLRYFHIAILKPGAKIFQNYIFKNGLSFSKYSKIISFKNFYVYGI